MKRRYNGAVGIDLGTTTTSLAVYDEIAQKAECLCNKDGTHTLPSVVCFQESGECVIGKIAKEEYLIYPDRTMINPKKLRGKQDKSFLIDGEIVYPEDAEQYILEDVRKAAESELDQEIKEVVLAVPISFGDTERKATVKIAEAAGIHVKLIDEPVAGIYHYSSLDDLNGKVCMVFDLGGGTLDISVVYVSNHQITVLAEVGEMLGGSDFDKAIEKYIREKYLREVILEADEEAQLASSVENAKIRLSQTESKSSRIMLMTSEGRKSISFSLEEMEECTSGLMNRIRGKLDEVEQELEQADRQTLKELGLKDPVSFKDIQELFLVGGMTKMPQIKNLLEDKERFPNARIHAKNQEEAVACGAAVYAKMLEEDENAELSVVKAYHPKKLVQISSHSYGIRVFEKERKIHRVTNLIFKGSRLPVEAKKIVLTLNDSQETIPLYIYESSSREETVETSDAMLLGKCTINIPGECKLPAASEVEVTFQLNDNAILSVTGLEPESKMTINKTWEVKNEQSKSV